MATLSYNETQGALKAKMETYGEGHVFQYATDGLELHTLCSQLSAVDMDRQKELYQKVICAAESGSRFEGATIEAVNNPNALTSTEEETKNLWHDNYYTALSQGKLALYNSYAAVDFEFHISEEDTLVYRILELAGIVMDKTGLAGTAGNMKSDAEAANNA